MIGVVLNGGASSLMGRPKGDVTLGTRTMADHVVGALRQTCDTVVAAGSRLTGLEWVPDPEPASGRGPLAGVVAALSAVGAPILVVAVDQPWVRVGTLRGLIEVDTVPTALSVVPVTADSRQVTCAVYHPDLLPDARRHLAGGSIQSLLDVVEHRAVAEDEWSAWDEDGRSWFSVDTPAALDEGLRRYGIPAGTGSSEK